MRPPTFDSISFISFIASMMQTIWPGLTASPSRTYGPAVGQEERDLDNRARLERGRLRPALRRVAAHARIGARDPQLGEVRQIDRHRRAVDVEDVDLGVLLEIESRVADLVRGERHLLVRLRV